MGEPIEGRIAAMPSQAAIRLATSDMRDAGDARGFARDLSPVLPVRDADAARRREGGDVGLEIVDDPGGAPDIDPVRRFADAALRDDAQCSLLRRLVDDHAARARDPDDTGAIVDELLVPAARLLGEFWLEDDADFVEVTLATHRISRILMELEVRGGTVAATRGPVLLAHAPGDQHGFGLMVVGFHLRRAGWRVELLEDAAAAGRRMATDPPLAIAISAAHGRSLDRALALIAGLRGNDGRSGHRTAAPAIALGGAAVSADPGKRVAQAADFVTNDYSQLIKWLNELENSRSRSGGLDRRPAPRHGT